MFRIALKGKTNSNTFRSDCATGEQDEKLHTPWIRYSSYMFSRYRDFKVAAFGGFICLIYKLFYIYNLIQLKCSLLNSETLIAINYILKLNYKIKKFITFHTSKHNVNPDISNYFRSHIRGARAKHSGFQFKYNIPFIV